MVREDHQGDVPVAVAVSEVAAVYLVQHLHGVILQDRFGFLPGLLVFRTAVLSHVVELCDGVDCSQAFLVGSC